MFIQNGGSSTEQIFIYQDSEQDGASFGRTLQFTKENIRFISSKRVWSQFFFQSPNNEHTAN